MPVAERRRAGHLVAGAAALALASAVAVATASPASADPATHGRGDVRYFLPAGSACADFDLLLEGTADKRAIKELDNGVLIEAGNGWDLTFTRVENGTPVGTVELLSNGSVNKTTTNADGVQTIQSTGKNVLILFPTDVPAGPSTTLYTGGLVYTIDTTGVFTVVSSSGKTTDICALLA
jgi:hypothetical protein